MDMCIKDSNSHTDQEIKCSYDVGDSVTIKSKQWYDKNKNFNGYVILPHWVFDVVRSKYCDKEMIVERVEWSKTYPVYKLKNCSLLWTEDMFQ